MAAVNVSMPTEMLAEVDRIAYEHRVPRSIVFQEAVKALVNKLDKGQPLTKATRKAATV